MELVENNSFTYPGAELATGVGPFVPDGVPTNGVGFAPNQSAQGATISDPGVWPEGVIFRNDVERTDEQLGIFGEATMDIGDHFALTVGARWYDIEVDLKGSAAGSFSNKGSLVDSNGGNNLDELFSSPNPDTASTDGVIGKVSFAWTPNDYQLWYATVSEGFRSGLLNRPGGAVGPTGFVVPYDVDTDDVVNYELGWKLDLFDASLRFNGNLFFVEISDLQTTIFDPSITNLFFSDNAADAEVMGIEGDISWAPASISGLLVNGSFSMLDTEITDVITPTDDVREGDELAFAPEFQATLRARMSGISHPALWLT
jgi:outer membrane receptor protein involved in Fe transport